jgi:tRNA threonylcarbamoyladenosine biosynthesis protein TsaE
MKEIKIGKKSELKEIVRMVLEDYKEYRIFAFYGELGSGKTTLIQEICKALDMEDVVNSPTFSIVNEYWSKNKKEVVYHFDFYRINKIEEVYDFGYEEYFYSGHYCFIEWPELINEIIPPDTIPVFINVGEDEERIFRFER